MFVRNISRNRLDLLPIVGFKTQFGTTNEGRNIFKKDGYEDLFEAYHKNKVPAGAKKKLSLKFTPKAYASQKNEDTMDCGECGWEREVR